MDAILVVNAGSSSVKFRVFEVEPSRSLRQLISGQIDGIGFNDIKQRDSVKKDLGARIGNKSFVTTSGMCLMVNMNRPPWNDIRVREAIALAVENVRFGRGGPFGARNRALTASR